MAEAVAHYEQREQELGEPVMREVERQVMMKIIDQKWREHLEEMDYLREGIDLRAMGQKDPLTEWQREGYAMFEAMMGGVAQDFVRYAMQVQVNVNQQPAAVPAVRHRRRRDDAAADAREAAARRRGRARAGADARGRRARACRTSATPRPTRPRRRRHVRRRWPPARAGARAPPKRAAGGQHARVKSDWDKTPRNAPCPCGSGKKFKLCHGK